MEFKRDIYLKRLQDRQGNGLIKIITGARRVGKSYLMNEIFYKHLIADGIPEDHILRFAFDSDEDIDLLYDYYPSEETKITQTRNLYLVNSRKFRAFLRDHTDESGTYYLLLDEVQLLDSFTSTLNSLLRNKNYDIYVSGSNSRFLSSDIATEFKGRGSVVHVLPLSFSEYYEGLCVPPDEAWKSYIVTGGIPLIALMKTEEEKADYLKNLCEETYLKDIIAHHGIRKQEALADTFHLLASMIGTSVNILRIANTFESVTGKKISDDTIADYIDYFQDAFILSKALKYDIKGRKYINSPFKVYFEDIGVRNALLNFRQIEETHIMENILYNELRYRGFSVDCGSLEILEKKSSEIYIRKELEVDFIAVRGSEKIYIQSALRMNSPEKESQEKRSLNAVDDSFRKIIVTRNGLNPSRDEKGIDTIDLFDFLSGSQI